MTRRHVLPPLLAAAGLAWWTATVPGPSADGRGFVSFAVAVWVVSVLAITSRRLKPRRTPS